VSITLCGIIFDKFYIVEHRDLIIQLMGSLSLRTYVRSLKCPVDTIVDNLQNCAIANTLRSALYKYRNATPVTFIRLVRTDPL